MSEQITINGLLRRVVNLLVLDRICSSRAMHAQDELNNYLVRCGVDFPDGDDLLDMNDDDDHSAEKHLDRIIDEKWPEERE